MIRIVRLYWYFLLALSIYYFTRLGFWMRRQLHQRIIPFEHQT